MVPSPWLPGCHASSHSGWGTLLAPLHGASCLSNCLEPGPLAVGPLALRLAGSLKRFCPVANLKGRLHSDSEGPGPGTLVEVTRLSHGAVKLNLSPLQLLKSLRCEPPSDSAPLTSRHHKSKPRRRPDPMSHSSLAVEALDCIDPLGGSESPCHDDSDHDATMQHENSRSARAAHGIGQRARQGRHGALTASALSGCVPVCASSCHCVSGPTLH